MSAVDEGEVPMEEPARRLGAMVSVRFTPGEVELMKAVSRVSAVTLSQFVRSSALSAAESYMNKSFTEIIQPDKKYEEKYTLEVTTGVGNLRSTSGLMLTTLNHPRSISAISTDPGITFKGRK